MTFEQQETLEFLNKSGQLTKASEYRDFLRMANFESQKDMPGKPMTVLDSLKLDLEVEAWVDGTGPSPYAY